MQSKEFPNNINLIKKFENKSPPVVPYIMQILADDLVYRAATNVINPGARTLKALFRRSQENIKQNADTIQGCLSALMNEKKPSNDKVRTIVRMNVTKEFNTDIIFGSFLNFFHRCEEPFFIEFAFPIDTFVILGPSLQPGATDETRFTRELDSFIREYSEDNAVHKDFFCYIMQMLTNIIQICRENHKPNPIPPTIITYQIAKFFAPKFIKIKCQFCKSFITNPPKPCKYCKELIIRCRFPVNLCVVISILMHIPAMFWENSISNPRPGVLIRRNSNQILKEALKVFRPTRQKISARNHSDEKSSNTVLSNNPQLNNLQRSMERRRSSKKVSSTQSPVSAENRRKEIPIPRDFPARKTDTQLRPQGRRR